MVFRGELGLFFKALGDAGAVDPGDQLPRILPRARRAGRALSLIHI